MATTKKNANEEVKTPAKKCGRSCNAKTVHKSS